VGGGGANSRDKSVVALGIVALASAATAFVTTWSIVGAVYDHTVFWIAVPGLVGLVAVGIALSRAMPEWLTRHSSGIIASGLLVCLTAGVSAMSLVEAERNASSNPVVYRLTNDYASYIARHGAHSATWEFSQDAWQEGIGVALQAWKQHLPMAVPAVLEVMTGPHFVPTGRETVRLRLILCDSAMPDDAGQIVTRRGTLCIVVRE